MKESTVSMEAGKCFFWKALQNWYKTLSVLSYFALVNCATLDKMSFCANDFRWFTLGRTPFEGRKKCLVEKWDKRRGWCGATEPVHLLTWKGVSYAIVDTFHMLYSYCEVAFGCNWFHSTHHIKNARQLWFRWNPRFNRAWVVAIKNLFSRKWSFSRLLKRPKQEITQRTR